ncbi:DNA gyrase inhibitor YacG [Pseudovibrio exalbescens]|uniref:DNA gyrase inhibitor YacG n=1 Tax=Pseudovibrio exalbescens TaxID=197461 RepID=UPI000400267A|nr:DNA gyrase inhibitor YacG [Pseudovibrio exalbescens]
MAKQHENKECPICEKPAQPAFAPFCSERCRKVDLNRWLSDSYAIPAEEQEPDFDDYADQMPNQMRH